MQKEMGVYRVCWFTKNQPLKYDRTEEQIGLASKKIPDLIELVKLKKQIQGTRINPKKAIC